jgi:hypothetical protein
MSRRAVRSGILRTAAQVNKLNLGDFGNLPCLGVYSFVYRPSSVLGPQRNVLKMLTAGESFGQTRSVAP